MKQLAATIVVAMLWPAHGETAEIKAAGCLIVLPEGVVVNINRLLNRIQLPIGRHINGESARQTAARETLEETGIEVVVGEKAMGLDENTIHLFMCTPQSPLANYNELEPRDTVEVSDVLVLNPYTMRNHDGRLVKTRWRFPQTRLLLEALFATRRPSS